MSQAFIKQTIAVALVFGLLLMFAGNLDAQQLYEPPPAMRLSKSGVVDQLVNGLPNESESASGRVVRDHSSAREDQLFGAPKSEDARAGLPRQAIYETVSPGQEDWDRILNASAVSRHGTLTTTSEPKSFIEREKPNAAEKRDSARDLIAKISINLAFVLAIAFGFILLARQWQKSKLIQHIKPSARHDNLNVSQVLRLTNGASLHVVEGFANKCLVAIDAGGIKSVNLLTPAFEETLERTESQEAPTDTRTHEPIVTDESTTEIDEHLIKLLLQSSKKAA